MRDKQRVDAHELLQGETPLEIHKWISPRISVFCDNEKMAYARILVNRHREVYEIRGSGFADWLVEKIVVEGRMAPSTATIDAVCRTLEAEARSSKIIKRVHLRAAQVKDNIYIDLGRRNWQAVEVNKKEWRVVTRPSAMFRRTALTRPLPIPKLGGSVEDLLAVSNIPKEDLIFVLAWMMECFRPKTPYAGLLLVGSGGSAKSGTLDVLCSLVDPNADDRKVRPSNSADIFANAKHTHLVRSENLASLTPDMQDAFCTMLTGGAYIGRKLHTNADIVSFSIKRPVILNSIKRVVTAPDLLDRFVVIDLPFIPEHARKTEEGLRAEFRALRPKLFGALLTQFSNALALLPTIRAEKKPTVRMADFAELGEAVARSMGMKSGWFIDAYKRRRHASSEEAVSDSPLGAAILAHLAENPDALSGTYSEIGGVLRQRAQATGFKMEDWPMTGKAFGDELRRLQAALGQQGVVVELGRRIKKGYTYRISRGPGS